MFYFYWYTFRWRSRVDELSWFQDIDLRWNAQRTHDQDMSLKISEN